MSYILYLISFVMHLDKHLAELFVNYGEVAYAILFAIIFSETGLVMFPFLPGDSLLFVIGALASKNVIDGLTITVLLSLAAILGNIVNYQIGKMIGVKLFRKEKSIFFNKKYLEKAHSFYEKYGPEAIILTRFIPILRTFAPFVAGMGSMSYGKFMLYNAFGGLIWVLTFILSGYFFGNIPLIKENFSLVIFAIIIISVLPAVFVWAKEKYFDKIKEE